MQMLQKLTVFIILSICFSSCATLKKGKLWEQGTLNNLTAVTTIPFEERSGMIFVKVNIEGKDFDFLLDTGAPNVLDKQTLAAIGAKEYNYGSVGDAYNRKEKLGFTINKSFKVGNLQYENIGALVADFRSVPVFNCMGIDGLLGANLMKKAVWQFDFQRKEIRIAPSIDAFNLKNADELSFVTARTGTPKTSLRVGDKVIEHVTIDFGSGNGITLLSKALPATAIKDTVILSTGAAGVGLYGVSKDTVRYVYTDSLELGDAAMIPAVVRARSKTGGLLGLKFWRNYEVTFDWGNGKLYLEAKKGTKMQSMSFGFGLEKRSAGYFISSLSLPSPASAEGLLLGDQILSLNGKSLEGVDYCEVLDILGTTNEISLEAKRETHKFSTQLKKEDLFMNAYKQK